MAVDEGASKGKRALNWISFDGFGEEGIANGFMLIMVILVLAKGLCGLLINSGSDSLGAHHEKSKSLHFRIHFYIIEII